MSLRRVKTIFKSPKEDIFDFNHICPTMDQETLQTVKDFYRFYHKKLWCAKRAFKKFKRLNLALTMSSTGLVALGAILGGVTLNPFILGVVSGAGLALKTFQEIKDPKKKIEMTRFVVTNYEKVLINLKTAMRLGIFNSERFTREIEFVDEMVADLCLNFESYETKYRKTFKI